MVPTRGRFLKHFQYVSQRQKGGHAWGEMCWSPQPKTDYCHCTNCLFTSFTTTIELMGSESKVLKFVRHFPSPASRLLCTKVGKIQNGFRLLTELWNPLSSSSDGKPDRFFVLSIHQDQHLATTEQGTNTIDVPRIETLLNQCSPFTRYRRPHTCHGMSSRVCLILIISVQCSSSTFRSPMQLFEQAPWGPRVPAQMYLCIPLLTEFYDHCLSLSQTIMNLFW